MKTTTKYLCFEELEASTKTKKFLVTNKYDSRLGYIKWFAPWRRYCLFTGGLVFDSACLADIQDFINTLMDERRRKQNDTDF